MRQVLNNGGISRYVACSALLACSATVLADQPLYNVIDLGTLGGELANALGINSHGAVVGQAEKPGFITSHFIWVDGLMTAVPGLNPNDGGRADGINDAGHVVGSSMAPYPGGPGSVAHAFFWSPETGPIDLTPKSLAMSAARAINNNNQIVGDMGGPAGGARLWEIDAKGNVTATSIALPGGPAGFINQAYDINDHGLVVGVGYNESFQFRAWKWQDSGSAIELPNLGGSQTIAEAVNNNGEIAGSAQLPNNLRMPVVWKLDGSIVQLGHLPVPGPIISSEARGINNHGHVVGAELYADPNSGLGVSAPWVWIDGQKWDLNDLIPAEDQDEWQLTWAIDINDSGQIVGIAIRTIDGEEYHGRAFLMTPVDTTSPYDLNGDGSVDVSDLLLLFGSWGPCAGCAADFNGDGFVDVSDLLALFANWG